MVVLKIVSVLFVILALAFLEAYLTQRDSLKAADNGVLAYGFYLKVVSLILTTGFLWGGYIVNSTIPNRSTNILLLATFLFFTLVCFALLLETFFVRIRYSVWGLLTSSPWRPSREVPWHSITSCRWCGSYEWHVLETRGYGKVRLHSYLAGLPEFFSMLEEKRPELFGEDEPT